MLNHIIKIFFFQDFFNILHYLQETDFTNDIIN